MTITATQNGPVDGPMKLMTASHFDDAGSPAAATFYPGFRPRHVEVENETDRILWVWREGNAAATNVATAAAGTRTIITSGGVTVTITAGTRPSISFAVLQNKQYRIKAEG